MKAKLNRRDFFSLSIPATGAIFVAPGFLNFQILSEINGQFTGDFKRDEYDLVINGAGLSGYFAAISAAKKGLKVLIIDKRPSPGFEITAKRKLWLGTDGLDAFDEDLSNLFFPAPEMQEVFREGGVGPNKSKFGDELALLAGSVKKGLLRNLLVNKVHVLLMTDVCGIFTDGKNVNGALLACKHGLYSVKCKSFVDASDNLIFSREIFKQNYQIENAGFVLELLHSGISEKKELEVPGELGILNNKVALHPGKNVDHQAFLEMKFEVDGQNLEDIELQSRLLAFEVGKKLSSFHAELKDAKIHYYAFESSVFLSEQSSPKPNIQGYYVLPSEQNELTCKRIIELQSEANSLVNEIKPRKENQEAKKLMLVGAEIPYKQISFSDPDEPGLSVPLKKCTFDVEKHVGRIKKCQVLVGGGGTSGALAGISAQEAGAGTIVVDYFNDLGGTKTLGGVMGYYHGMKDNPFIKELENESRIITSDMNTNGKVGRQVYLWNRLAHAGGKFLTGAIICDTLVSGKKVEGIVVCRNGKLEIVKGELTIDATGDGDIAFFAGANFSHGDLRTGQTQNYSQWNLTGGSKPPSNPNCDYDVIDNTKISELQRALFLSHYEAHFYDFHPYLTIRESRRIKGLYEIDLLDAVEGTHYEDLISVASSDFDPHYVDNSEYTRCGFLLPHSNILKVEIPYRSIVPAALDGILISGKAFSQTHLALQFTRMSADLTILGYLTGQVAASIVDQNIKPKDFDISSLQKQWFAKGYLPEEYVNKKVGNNLRDLKEIERRVDNLSQGKNEYLYECCRLPKDLTVPVLKGKFESTSNENGKLLVAKVLSWFGESLGNRLIVDELTVLFDEEQRNGYEGGYVEDYDNIRDRKENRLEGTFWRINQNIALLAMAENTENNAVIQRILENTTSGGGPVLRTGPRADYFNVRIDLRIIPFFNRIFNLCFYAERLPDQLFARGFERLLDDQNIKGFVTEEYDAVRWRIYRSDLELYIGATLARCGSLKGYGLLVGYLDDLHYRFKGYAHSELKSLTNKDFGFHAVDWTKHCDKLSYPQPTQKIQREIEV
jgi:ribulose 1,5-bisphosphate synthetase/thiazole synthase